ncbi:MAG: hypothetical protein NT027_14945 [Proteobacteria bacterium]|nr:hypothetical protein [Pseudomonadota bacterium]
MDSIASIIGKAATSISCKPFKWVHEDYWEDQHKEFARECLQICKSNRFSFYDAKPKRSSRRAYDKSGIFQIGKWILESESDQGQKFQSLVLLECDSGTFQRFLMRIDHPHKEKLDTHESDNHPLNWILEFILARLNPDLLIVCGDIPSHLSKSFPVKEVLSPELPCATESPQKRPRGLEIVEVLEMTSDQWKVMNFRKPAAMDLVWIDKTNQREERDIRKANTPRKGPFLFRLLKAMSPIRRQKREPMIHPLDKYKGPL